MLGQDPVVDCGGCRKFNIERPLVFAKGPYHKILILREKKMFFEENTICIDNSIESIEELANIQNKESIAFAQTTPDQLEEYQKEIDLINMQIALNADSGEHIEKRGDLKLKMGLYLDALLDYREAEKLGLDDEMNAARQSCAQGLIKEQAGWFHDAREDYQLAIDFDNRNGYYHLRKGCIDLKLNNLSEVMESLPLAVKYGCPDGPGNVPNFQIFKDKSKMIILPQSQ